MCCTIYVLCVWAINVLYNLFIMFGAINVLYNLCYVMALLIYTFKSTFERYVFVIIYISVRV